MSLFEKPARKLFINHCSKLKQVGSHHQKNYRSWTLSYKNKIFPVELIWIQGSIVKVLKSADSFIINDSTGTATIVSASKAPGYGSWITNDQYAMVIGEVLSTETNIEIRAMKLTMLSDLNPEALWKLEVQDFWNFLAKS
ncbi:unnamed protein product [Larinioides sclopetarius]|uniref:Uncharacterized protein n=1 Tax=Larinioides sclopetarius TaxID=280406 RepID=A0AAV1Z3Y9_9ARAC